MQGGCRNSEHILNIMREKGFPFTFDPTACENCVGHCCTGESGYTWVSQIEISRIAAFLKQDTDFLISQYLVRIGRRFCIREVKIQGSFYCLFFDERNRRCTIYDVRPAQCRTFPFWDYFRDNPEEVVKECPGVRRIQVRGCRASEQ